MKHILIQANEQLLEEFARGYRAKEPQATVNVAYLTKAKVRAFFDNNGQLLGGYAVSSLNRNPTLRYFDFISAKAKDQALWAHKLNEQDFVEITYIFFLQNASFLTRQWILIRSIVDALSEGKRYILGGGKVGKFNNRMKAVLNHTLVEQQVLVYNQPVSFSIFYGKRNELLLNLLLAVVKEQTNRLQALFF